ncbi:TadE/TadG family type IV pilus assembly protein [Prosthecomicrobium sp. N25]|uniref:TadE/TadG family type IV pilus assembly protein n=1 Tax=Prosthecomicrobium sp. N25 TaxID=3129254 RepID=UPI003076DC83
MTARLSRPLAAAADRLARLRRRLVGDRRGVSAIEFALLLPVMVILFFGGHEVGQAITIYRKVSHTANVLGDLVAQVNSLTTTDMSNVYAAAKTIMSPYKSSNATMVVATVSWDGTKWKVEKANPSGTLGWVTGSPPPAGKSPPDSLKSTTQWVVVSSVQYTYTTAFKAIMSDIWGTDSITMGDTAYLRPRISDKVTLP